MGPIAFIGAYILATLLFLPGSVLTLGAGIVFGVAAGSIYVFIGATIGATLAFLVGRYVARDWVMQRMAGNETFKAIDQAIGQSGLKIIFLTRLSPIFPYNLLNYALGVTQVTLRSYVLGCVGMIPGTVLYVYVGALTGNLANATAPTATAQTAQWIMRILGFAATVAVTLYVSRIANTALQHNIAVAKAAATKNAEAAERSPQPTIDPNAAVNTDRSTSAPNLTTADPADLAKRPHPDAIN